MCVGLNPHPVRGRRLPAATKTVLLGGMTMDTWLLPQIDQAYRQQRMPPLLPGVST